MDLGPVRGVGKRHARGGTGRRPKSRAKTAADRWGRCALLTILSSRRDSWGCLPTSAGVLGAQRDQHLPLVHQIATSHISAWCRSMTPCAASRFS